MENEITSKEEVQTQASGYIEEAVRKIYEEHPHEIRAILYGAAS